MQIKLETVLKIVLLLGDVIKLIIDKFFKGEEYEQTNN